MTLFSGDPRRRHPLWWRNLSSWLLQLFPVWNGSFAGQQLHIIVFIVSLIIIIIIVTIILLRAASTRSRAGRFALLAMNSSSRKLVQDVEKLFQVFLFLFVCARCGDSGEVCRFFMIHDQKLFLLTFSFLEGLKFRDKRFHAACFTCVYCQVFSYLQLQLIISVIYLYS